MQKLRFLAQKLHLINLFPHRQLHAVSLAAGHPYQGVVILVLLSDWQPGGGGTVMVNIASRILDWIVHGRSGPTQNKPEQKSRNTKLFVKPILHAISSNDPTRRYPRGAPIRRSRAATTGSPNDCCERRLRGVVSSTKNSIPGAYKRCFGASKVVTCASHPRVATGV